MQLIKRLRGLGNRASISVEMALITTFVLLPLLAGAADFVVLIVAKAQLASTLRAFYAFAWNNPSAAGNTGDLGLILSTLNQHSLPQVTFPDGKTDNTTSYQPSLEYLCTDLSGVTSQQSTACPSGETQQVLVTYQVITKVNLPIPLPIGLTSPFQLVSSGQVQIQ
jgi:hypothetical protein